MTEDTGEIKETTKESFDSLQYCKALNAIDSFINDSPKTKEEQIKSVAGFSQHTPILRMALDVDDRFFDVLVRINKLAYFPNARSFVRSFIEEHIKQIEKRLQKDNLGERGVNGTVLETISNLLSDTDSPAQKELGSKVLERNISIIESGLKNNDSWRDYVYPLGQLIVYGHPKTQAHIDQFILDLLSKKETETRGLEILSELCTSESGDAKQKGQDVLGKVFEGYGLDAKDLFEWWEETQQEGKILGRSQQEIIETNFQAIHELEVQRPGITRVLNREFGIRNFARYPIDLLINQYDQIDNVDLPYGIVIFPKGDHNGAFYEFEDKLKQISEQLDGKYTIRVSEAASKFEIAKALIRFNRRYGQHHKISFAIIGGHGSKDSIKFGESFFGDELDVEDLKGRGVQRTSEFFEANPTIILNSCSTGVEGGIGQKLSEAIGATVIAPERLTGRASINVKLENGRLNFEVDYPINASKEVYDKGKLSKLSIG